jgi:hypothetical protein
MPSMRAAPFLWGLLHAGHAHLEQALAKLTWSLCWLCSFYLLSCWVSSPASTDAVMFSGCDVLIKLYDLNC